MNRAEPTDDGLRTSMSKFLLPQVRGKCEPVCGFSLLLFTTESWLFFATDGIVLPTTCMNQPSGSIKRRILVVDDEVFVCEAIKMMLGFDGHSVETAANGAEGLEKFENGKYDVIFTDFAMPVMQGDRFAAAIKERSPTQPVIMLSAHGTMLLATGKQLPGVDLILEKPFRLDTLRHAIEKVLSAAPEKMTTSPTGDPAGRSAAKSGSTR